MKLLVSEYAKEVFSRVSSHTLTFRSLEMNGERDQCNCGGDLIGEQQDL